MPFRQRLNTRKKVRLSVLITVLLWFSLLSLFFFTNPDTNLLVVVFFVNFFLALLFLFSILLLSTRRGLMISIAATLFLIMRLAGTGNVLNLLLIIGILIALEFYFGKPS